MDGFCNTVHWPGDYLGQKMRNLSRKKINAANREEVAIMESILPLLGKNSRKQDQDAEGTETNHFKVPDMHEWFAVMAVIPRPLMRMLFPEGRELCDEIGPFEHIGKCLTVPRLRELFQYIGHHLIGIPNLGYNIPRSILATETCLLAFATGQGVDTRFVKTNFRRARGGQGQLLSSYNQVESSCNEADPTSIESRASGLVGISEYRAEVQAGKASVASSSPTSTVQEFATQVLRVLTDKGAVSLAPTSEPADGGVSPTPGVAAGGGGAPSSEAAVGALSPALSIEQVVAVGGGVVPSSVSPTPSTESVAPVVVAGGGAALSSVSLTPSTESSRWEAAVGSKRAAPGTAGTIPHKKKMFITQSSSKKMVVIANFKVE